MARPKDDAENLSKNREERRALIRELGSYEDSEEYDEKTTPGLLPGPPMPPPRAQLASSETLLAALDKTPPQHRVWVILAVIAAVLAVLLLAGRFALR